MNSKKLCRSRKNVLLAGVCAGLAEYFDHDPTLWRLGFALFLVLTGFMPGVLLYIIAWIVMPVASEVTFEDITSKAETVDVS
jgi:phage shock protein C